MVKEVSAEIEPGGPGYRLSGWVWRVGRGTREYFLEVSFFFFFFFLGFGGF
jgi:hypothetical protein